MRFSLQLNIETQCHPTHVDQQKNNFQVLIGLEDLIQDDQCACILR